MRPILVILCAAVFMAGCLRHIAPYKPKQRAYSLPQAPAAPAPQGSPGSLWSAAEPANYIFSDQRALLVNDVVTIRIDEESSAFSDASTDLDRQSDTSVGIEALMGFLDSLKAANPNFDPKSMIGASFQNTFQGKGQTSRRGDVKAIVPAIVRKVLGNNSLFIEGHRVILVNNEEYHFYISGVVRPIDIDGTNSVDSSKIADAQIEFTGRGALTEKQSPGWFARLIDAAWPF